MANPSKELKVRYQQDLMIWRTPLLRAGLLTLLFLYVLSPIIWESFIVTKFLDDIGLTMTTLNYAGVFAVGAIGLNLLTGYTGQVSLGHSVFVGAGAYFTAYAGSTWEFRLALNNLATVATLSLPGVAADMVHLKSPTTFLL